MASHSWLPAQEMVFALTSTGYFKSTHMAFQSTAPNVFSKLIACTRSSDAAGITYKTNSKATAVDVAGKSITLHTGETISYEKLIIATGAEVRLIGAMTPVSHCCVSQAIVCEWL